jgi:hypothetical protein
LSGEIEGYAPGNAVITVRSGGAAADITTSVTATVASLRVLTERAHKDGGIRQHGIAKALLSKLDEAAAGKPDALRGYIALLRHNGPSMSCQSGRIV